MATICVFSEDGALAQQLLSPALQLKKAADQQLVALTLDESTAKSLVAGGADRVLLLQSTPAAPEALAPAIAQLCVGEGASVVLIGGTLRGKHIAAHVAAHLQAGLTTDAKTLRIAGGKLQCTRVLYAGLGICEEEVDLPAVATIPPRTFLAPKAADTAGTVQSITVEPDMRVAVVNVTQLSTEGIDITMANKLLSVGRGFRNKEDLKLAEELATVLKAEIACTRGIAEDEHWLPVARYVGISGQNVKPELYLAIGLSGQVQHMVGCRESKVIVAVNNDEHAPVFQTADYGIVGDLYQVLPLLTAALKN